MTAVRLSRSSRLAVLVLTTITTAVIAAVARPSSDLRPDYHPAAYAIKGAKIIPGAGAAIAQGTVVVRNGLIEAVGPDDQVTVPYDAEIIEGKGLIVYPGFLDLYTTLGAPATAARSKTGPGRNVPYNDFALPRTPEDDRRGITPEFEVATVLELPQAPVEERRKLGFTALLAAPGGAIVTGQSALASLSGLPRRESVLASPVGLHIALRPPVEPPSLPGPNDNPAVARRRGTGIPVMSYPVSLMGVIAHLRQNLLDAQHDQALRAYEARKGGLRLPYDPALQVLRDALEKRLPIWWEANTRDEIHRVLDLADEFGTTTVIVGGREAGKVAQRLKKKDVPVVLRLDFPDEPKVPTEAEYRKRPIADRAEPLKVLADKTNKWKERVGTAKALRDAGVRFAFCTDGVAKAETFPDRLRKVMAAGLPADAALQALTIRAAEIAGLSRKLGTIEPGKLGHLVVMTGPLDDESAKVRYVLVDGLKFDLEKAEPPKKGEGRARSKEGGKAEAAKGKSAPPETAKPRQADEKPKAEEKAKAEPAKAEEKAKPEPAKAEEKAKPEPTKAEEQPKAKSEAKSETPKTETPKTEPAKPEAKAEATPGELAPTREPAKPAPPARQSQTGAVPPPPKTEEDQPPSGPFIDVTSELDADRKPKIKTGGHVLIKDATILTVAPQGTIPKGSILIRDGKIVAVGGDVPAPEGVTVIDAAGLVAMPGIIDTHSHMAIQGGVNEMSLSVVPEVRVRDVVTGDDPTIYRALAGGVTSARLLHGSANTIGGQDVVIKLRYGQAGRDLIVHGGDQGVKFALGENVTRRAGRFPNTRMGVEATIERAFDEARAYKAAWSAYEAARGRGDDVPPPRRDLRLEALAGVLDGSIKIHAHCYRSDEILMLLRVAARNGVRVRSLQHVLEGYKVAAEIAAHGASASTFSDWWAYKVEAYDAIPYNTALLMEAGAKVCIKSDDEELVRHLYLEAAKMVKYGGATEAQALEMITLNPARQLGLESRLGSIEVGKDADIVLFNAHPFDSFARCELALIDGEVWFQRPEPDGKLAPRPGDHTAMPSASAEAKAKTLDLARDPKGVYALTGATLHPVSGPDIENGTIVIADGKIATLGGPDTPIPPGARSIDAKGLDVWPGLIDAGSVIGLFEIGSLPETQDAADTAPFEPELRTSTALHPDSEIIPVTRANGVLSTYVQPTGGTIAGQGCVIDLEGWVPSEMVVADRLALDVYIPREVPRDLEERRMRQGFFRQQAPEGVDPNQQRKERIEQIKEQFRQALAYDKVVSEANVRKALPPVPDPRMEALVPYAKGERPVIFHANARGEILDALKIAAELKLKAIISGGLEAWKVAEELKKAKVPVLIGGTLQLPPLPTDPYDAPYANPARLYEAGVEFAIVAAARGPNQATSARNLPYEAAVAVAYGLPEAEALKAVTLAPARILGVADRLGSLETGKRANLVITAGHILQPTTEVKGLFIAGKPVLPESRHTRLYAKYRQRLAEVRAGQAPLGIEPTPPVLAAPGAASPLPAAPVPSGANQR
jgi:imidazolonepropionase-like amidohydrolase